MRRDILLPPVPFKRKIRGILIISAIVGLSIGASHVFVPKMIAYTVMNGKFSSLTSESFPLIYSKMKKLPGFLEKHGIKASECVYYVDKLDASAVKAAAAKAIPKKDNPDDFIRTFLVESGLEPFCRQSVYDDAAGSLNASDVSGIIRVYNEHRNSMVMYLPALKIIMRDMLRNRN